MNNNHASRRSFLQTSAAVSLLGLGACASTSSTSSTTSTSSTSGIPSKAKVVVIGGGYGGATAAKYVRLLSDYKMDVVLIEPNNAFVSCPLSNLVVGGSRQMAQIITSYEGLSKNHGVRIVKDKATAIDADKKMVTLGNGSRIAYDKLVVSPGIELMMDSIEGLDAAQDAGMIVQAWKAGPETLSLRNQLQSMQDGGVFAITIPEAPYRCPPGPYERACQVAWYFKNFKPRSKVLILDANPDVTSKGPLFKKVWAEMYPGMVEYRGQHKTIAVNGSQGIIKFDVQEDVKANVINALPSMRAGTIAQQAGLNNMANKRWCGVNYQNFESTAAKDVHVLGDSIQIAPGMPKSGHMANGHGKVAAAAIVAQLSGWDINPAPMLTNTCYSFVSDKEVVHVASVHEYVAAEKTFKTVAGSGGVSPIEMKPEVTTLEATYANNWAQNIWADTLG